MPYRKNTRQLPAASFVEQLDKDQLHQRADRLLVDDHEALEQCVVFLESDSRGLWHNRARALMARRLKHCTVSTQQKSRLCTAILQQLCAGNFTEQFKDQLRLVL